MTVDEQREIFFEVETKHTKKMLRDFLKFKDSMQGRNPGMRFFVLAVGNAILTWIARGQFVMYIFGALSVLFLFFFIFRSWKLVDRLGKADLDYQNQTQIRLAFLEKGFEIIRGTQVDFVPYKKVTDLYEDMEHIYINYFEDDLQMFYKDELVVGDLEEFRQFLVKKVHKILQPVRLSWKEKLNIFESAWETNRQQQIEKDKKKKEERRKERERKKN